MSIERYSRSETHDIPNLFEIGDDVSPLIIKESLKLELETLYKKYKIETDIEDVVNRWYLTGRYPVYPTTKSGAIEFFKKEEARLKQGATT